MPASRTLAGLASRVAPPAPTPDWTAISQLMAGCETAGRALLADDPALEWTATDVRPAAVLLLEPAEPLMAADPVAGGTFDLQVEMLVRGGFGRLPLDATAPAMLPGWSVRTGPAGLELLDAGGNVWAGSGVTPGPGWLSTVDEQGHVTVLYGAWLGVRAPHRVTAEQYGPARQAAELRVARMRNLVAAAMVSWGGRSTRPHRA